MQEEKENRHLCEGPFDWNFALSLGSDLGESRHRQVNGVAIVTRRAIVSNNAGDGLLVVCVDDMNRLSAERGFCAGITITCLINCADEIAVFVDGTTGASDTVLSEESGNTTLLEGAAATAAAAAAALGSGLRFRSA